MSEASLGNTSYGYGKLMKQIEDYISQLENNSYKKISKEKVLNKLRGFLDYGEE